MRVAESRAVDGGTSLATLMERAGAAVADIVWRIAAGRAILILVGPGNNGGDGYVAARILAARGAHVRVAVAMAPTTDLARAAADAWDGPVESLSPQTNVAPVLVDALFGIGMMRPMADDLGADVTRLAHAADRVIAVDVPSGVDADSGAVLGTTIPAHLTIALGALKPSHVLLPAAAQCGRTVVAPIGLDVPSHMHQIGSAPHLVPTATDHKYRRGLVSVVAGAMPGAAELAALAAQRGGAGYVQLLGGKTPPVPPHSIVRRPFPTIGNAWDERSGAIVIGPGLGQDDKARERFEIALASGRPLVIDADALSLLGDRCCAVPAILTPHGGEFARMMGADAGQGSKIDQTLAAARKYQAVIIHKGADGIIAAPDGRIAATWPGNAWLASAGTGDVLAGLCGAMLARGLDPFDAACAACGVHRDWADAAGPYLIADDLVRKENL